MLKWRWILELFIFFSASFDIQKQEEANDCEANFCKGWKNTQSSDRNCQRNERKVRLMCISWPTRLISIAISFTRSMTDLDQNSSTHSPRRKFSFRFPNLSHSTSHDKDGSTHNGSNGHSTLNHHQGMHYAGKDRRNFSEEAKNVPDLQVSILLSTSSISGSSVSSGSMTNYFASLLKWCS
jgi:hypothetical protein